MLQVAEVPVQVAQFFDASQATQASPETTKPPLHCVHFVTSLGQVIQFETEHAVHLLVAESNLYPLIHDEHVSALVHVAQNNDAVQSTQADEVVSRK